jgi:hypothetical protein
MMKRVFLTTASLAIVAGMGAAAAMADEMAPTPPGVPVYGAVQGTPPAGAVPPQAPPGYQYRWVYSYDHHGYRGHWEAERIGM